MNVVVSEILTNISHIKDIAGIGELQSTEVAYLLLNQLPGVRFPVFPNYFHKEKLLMLLWLINGTG